MEGRGKWETKGGSFTWIMQRQPSFLCQTHLWQQHLHMLGCTRRWQIQTQRRPWPMNIHLHLDSNVKECTEACTGGEGKLGKDQGWKDQINVWPEMGCELWCEGQMCYTHPASQPRHALFVLHHAEGAEPSALAPDVSTRGKLCAADSFSKHRVVLKNTSLDL